MSDKMNFQAEVGKLLDIVVNSLYSERQIFLRELISNASDACDKLKYLALTHPDIAKSAGEFKIAITPDAKNATLKIADNGIGMNKEDLINHLGTIAKSGTAEFVKNVKDNGSAVDLIGQFGVGFYSAFMVASKVVDSPIFNVTSCIFNAIPSTGITCGSSGSSGSGSSGCSGESIEFPPTDNKLVS